MNEEKQRIIGAISGAIIIILLFYYFFYMVDYKYGQDFRDEADFFGSYNYLDCNVRNMTDSECCYKRCGEHLYEDGLIEHIDPNETYTTVGREYDSLGLCEGCGCHCWCKVRK